METKTNNNFKDYIQLLPYVSGLIVLISVIKAIIFYNVFGIRIVSYLDLSECILIFLDHLILMGIALVFTSVIPNILFPSKLNKGRSTYESNSSIRLNYTEKRKSIRNDIIAIIIVIVISLIAIVLVIYQAYPLYEIIIISITFLVFIASGPFVSILLYLKFPIYPYKISIITIAVNTYLGLIIISGLNEAYSIKHGMNIQNVNLTFKSNEIINTSDTLVYIGTTRNYLFFYNPINMKKTVFMHSELTKLSIQ